MTVGKGMLSCLISDLEYLQSKFYYQTSKYDRVISPLL